MTKEERKEYNRKYREKNKERLDAYNKAWNLNNKEKKATQNKALAESKKDGLFTVYLLPKENYVGQTSSLYARLITQKRNQGRDVSNVQILGKYKTREEAKAVEAEYHSKGYLGYHNGL
tara:strand:- start:57 stop:413 length:357 start_codon:yes stop_codon:yes gene_type:complete